MKQFIRNQYAMFWIFLGMLILPNIFMIFTESTTLFTRIINVVLPAGLYWAALTLKDKPGKMFWWLFIFIFFDAFEIVLLYLFGEAPIAVDMFLNVITTNVTEANELLIQIYPSVIFVVVVYVTGMVLAVHSVRNKKTLHFGFRHNHRIIGCGIALIGLVMLGINYFINPRFAIEDDIFPVNVSYNLALSVDRTIKSARYHSTSRDFTHGAVDTRPDSIPEVYVLVIGETAKADNMSLYGYARNTTPLLSALRDSSQLLAFTDAITMSNTTHKSVPMLLTATASEHSFDSLYHQHGIISAFCEAGYATVYLSNQRRNGSFIDFLGCEAEDVIFTKDSLPVSANVYDIELVKLLKSQLTAHAGHKLLVVLHCYGSHFDYRDRYPKEMERFSPTDYPSATASQRQKLLNAYDNTIAYADYIITQIISTLQQTGQPAVMVYTSDHGEDIYDDARGRFLHASPNPTYYHLRVPLLVWASPQWKQMHTDKWNAMASHVSVPVSTGMVMFHTMLDLAGVKARLLKTDNALGNGAFKASPRLYINDHNELRTLDNCGLKPIDVEQFKKHNIQYP